MTPLYLYVAIFVRVWFGSVDYHYKLQLNTHIRVGKTNIIK